MQEAFVRLAIAIVSATAAYFAGVFLERKRNRRRSAEKRAEDAVVLTRKVVEDAHSYFVTEKGDADRTLLQVSIHNNLKRLFADIHDLCCLAKCADGYYLKAWNGYYAAITDSPFGDEGFDRLSATDRRFHQISNSEDQLVRIIRSFEDRC